MMLAVIVVMVLGLGLWREEKKLRHTHTHTNTHLTNLVANYWDQRKSNNTIKKQTNKQKTQQKQIMM